MHAELLQPLCVTIEQAPVALGDKLEIISHAFTWLVRPESSLGPGCRPRCYNAHICGWRRARAVALLFNSRPDPAGRRSAVYCGFVVTGG